MKLNQFATMRGYQIAHQSINPLNMIDKALDGAEGDQLRKELLTKRLQFDCLPELYADVESTCALLECSKREFLDMAVREAIEQSQSIFMDSFQQARGKSYMDLFGVEK